METQKIIAGILTIAEELDNNGYTNSSDIMAKIAENIIKNENKRVASKSSSSQSGRVRKVIPYQNKFAQIQKGFNPDFAGLGGGMDDTSDDDIMDFNTGSSDDMGEGGDLDEWGRPRLQSVDGPDVYTDNTGRYPEDSENAGDFMWTPGTPTQPGDFGKMGEGIGQRDPNHFGNALDRLISSHQRENASRGYEDNNS